MSERGIDIYAIKTVIPTDPKLDSIFLFSIEVDSRCELCRLVTDLHGDVKVQTNPTKKKEVIVERRGLFTRAFVTETLSL